MTNAPLGTGSVGSSYSQIIFNGVSLANPNPNTFRGMGISVPSRMGNVTRGKHKGIKFIIKVL